MSHSEITGINGGDVNGAAAPQSSNGHTGNTADVLSWPSVNTSTSPEMVRMEIEKGERETIGVK